MSVRAKVFVERVEHVHTHTPGDVCANVTMKPVYNNGVGNESWSKYTPNGKIELTITNPTAIDQLSVGSEYFVTFDPVDSESDAG